MAKPVPGGVNVVQDEIQKINIMGYNYVPSANFETMEVTDFEVGCKNTAKCNKFISSVSKPKCFNGYTPLVI